MICHFRSVHKISNSDY